MISVHLFVLCMNISPIIIDHQTSFGYKRPCYYDGFSPLRKLIQPLKVCALSTKKIFFLFVVDLFNSNHQQED